jgi:hypothetical protein
VRTSRRLVLLLVAALALFAARAGAGSAYSWPIAPFFQPHPIISFFGDPRTIFSEYYGGGAALNGPGEFAFHNGIDIPAPEGTPVYPVVSGRARLLSGTAVLVHASQGRVFQYYHLQPTISNGQWVHARRTVIGTVLGWAKHVHLSEIDGGHVTNPLLRGHLAPYEDTTKPVVSSIAFRDLTGQALDPLALHGAVDIVASAHDTPPLALPGVAVPLPVAPAALSWSLTTPDGRVAVPLRTTVDFRLTLPFNRDFWLFYARGTYQNNPTFGGHVRRLDGRYLYHVEPNLFDTTLVPSGAYVLTVTAADERGNTGTLSVPVAIVNDLS